MPSKQTQNYGLSQWVKTDQVLMDDFNADNLAIDKAIKAQADAVTAEKTARESAVAAEKAAREKAQTADKSELTSMIKRRNCRIESTSYTGDTGLNAANNRRITFSKRPVVFFVFGGGALMVGSGASTVNIFHAEGTMSAQFPHQWDGNTLVMPTSSSTAGMNYTGNKYYAIGLIAED